MKLLRPCALFALFACALSCVDIFKEKKAEEDTQKQVSVSIIGVDGITSSSATLSASLLSIGTSKVTQKGFCWSPSNATPTLSDKSSNQGPSDAPGEYSATVTGLQPTTTYFCRAYAKNSVGIAYSDVLTFTTTEYQNPLPEVTIGDASDLSFDSVKLSATLTSTGTTKVLQKGFCWSPSNATPTLSDKSSSQGSADGPCSFSYELASLAPETKYYCRAYAVNAAGVAYSDVKSFTTLESYKVLAAYGFDNSDADDDYADYDGVALGEVKFIDDTPGKSGKALFLNGMKGGFVNIPYNPFKGTEYFSVALWIKDFTSGVLLYGKSSKSVYWDVPCIYMGDDDLFYFAVYSNTYGHYSLTFSYPYTAIQSSSWHHLVFTCSKKSYSNATLSLYVDGKFVDTGEASFTNDYNQNGITNIVIGGDRDGAYRAPTMKIDELILFGEALSASKVARIYENRGATRF